MKRLICIIILFLLEGCSSIKLTKDWKNPEIDLYEPTKVFIVGLTSHEEARFQFEKQLQKALKQRSLEAVISMNFLDADFKTTKQSEEQLNSVEQKLIKNGFDTIIFSKIIRTEDRVKYKKTHYNDAKTTQNFKEDYISSQQFFFNTDYYDAYKIYHLETTVYCICPTKEREILWKGYIEVVDPKSIDKTVNRYVKLVVNKLETQNLISSLTK
ncbi:hypothetical protein [uncultured Kordia sp.]|uniref:hypothetical protein n=1 Tax=uncultured Kordia sp. TaxID=507699 RepID=UPI00261D1F46|nr:hypothetical protein [uncultured Kordia sp.]